MQKYLKKSTIQGLSTGLWRSHTFGCKPYISDDKMQVPNSKLYLNKNSLNNNNVIELRFKKNDVLHPYLRRTRLSQDGTNVVSDIINNKYMKDL